MHLTVVSHRRDGAARRDHFLGYKSDLCRVSQSQHKVVESLKPRTHRRVVTLEPDCKRDKELTRVRRVIQGIRPTCLAAVKLVTTEAVGCGSPHFFIGICKYH